jgi:hypothetical protein
MPLGFGLGFLGLNLDIRAGLRWIASAIFPQKGGSHPIEHPLNLATILQGAL